ncbi:hypothetical protein [Peribacillus sp. SCS-37]|uniref:hypothetical protein n=1 Tax=Paraperibacillus esterisolvens TaxID=3115296 RepID=UPI003906A83C
MKLKVMLVIAWSLILLTHTLTSDLAFIIRKGKTSFIAGNHEMFVPKNEKNWQRRCDGWSSLLGSRRFCFPLHFRSVSKWRAGIAVLAGMNVLIVLIFMLIDQLYQIK